VGDELEILPVTRKISNEAMAQTQAVILLIEDNLDDVELFRLAVAHCGSPCKVVSVQFARDAIKYLERFGEYQDESQYPKPTLIVLDLSLPGLSGLDFLTWAKGEPTDNIPPIVVLSSSQLEFNRHLSQKLGAKAYFVKSPRPEEAAHITEELMLFNLPPSGSAEADQKRL
jgi:CheY-like chemotaxis protein